MNIGITLKAFKKFERRCFDGSYRSRRKKMMSFIEWMSSKELFKKKKKGKNNEQPYSQGSTEVRDFNQQGQANRGNKEVYSTDIHYFPEP